MKTITIFYDVGNNAHCTLVCDVDEGGNITSDHINVGSNIPLETPEQMWESAARLVGAANVQVHLTTPWEPSAEVVNRLPERFWGNGGQKSE